MYQLPKHFIEDHICDKFLQVLDTYGIWIAGHAMLWQYMANNGAEPQWEPDILDLFSINDEATNGMCVWFCEQGYYTVKSVLNKDVSLIYPHTTAMYHIEGSVDSRSYNKLVRLSTVTIPVVQYIQLKERPSVYHVARIPNQTQLWVAFPDHIEERIFTLIPQTFLGITADKIFENLILTCLDRRGFTYIESTSDGKLIRPDPRIGLQDTDCYFNGKMCWNLWTCEDVLCTQALVSRANILTRIGTRWYCHPRNILTNYLAQRNRVGPMREQISVEMEHDMKRLVHTIFILDGDQYGAYTLDEWQQMTKGGWKIARPSWKHDMLEERITNF